MAEPHIPPPHPEPLLENRVVVVLGGGQGIGLEAARAVNALQAQVMVADLEAAFGAETAALIEQSGGRAHFARTDPDDDDSLAHLAASARARWGPIDAVILEPPALGDAAVFGLSAADWEAIVSRRLRRALLAAQAFLPGMLDRGAGTLLSLVLPEVQAGRSALAAAQHGLIGFCQALAKEVAPYGVRVATLALRPNTPPEAAGLAAAHLLANPAPGFTGEPVPVDTILIGAGFSTVPFADRSGRLAHAIALSQQLTGVLMEADLEFDRMPVSVRPMARGSFVSKVGYRTEDVLRALTKLSDQLQRMQASQSHTDVEFQVDYPFFVSLLERLAGYYQNTRREILHQSADESGRSQFQRRMAERETLATGLLAALRSTQRRTN